jgi:hypothetical protein
VAVAWQIYALTGSALDLGLIGLMQFLPSAAFMLVAGQVADPLRPAPAAPGLPECRMPGRGGAGDRRALGLGEQGIHPGGGAGVKVDAVWTYIFSRAQQTRSGAELH